MQCYWKAGLRGWHQQMAWYVPCACINDGFHLTTESHNYGLSSSLLLFLPCACINDGFHLTTESHNYSLSSSLSHIFFSFYPSSMFHYKYVPNSLMIVKFIGEYICTSLSSLPEKTGRRPLLNCPSCPPDDPIGQGTELN